MTSFPQFSGENGGQKSVPTLRNIFLKIKQ
jgi:hypothetical protein